MMTTGSVPKSLQGGGKKGKGNKKMVANTVETTKKGPTKKLKKSRKKK